MLVDAEKVKEKLARIVFDHAPVYGGDELDGGANKFTPSDLSARIRATDLSDCAVVSDDAVVIAAKAALVIKSQAAEIERLRWCMEWLQKNYKNTATLMHAAGITRFADSTKEKS
jgi:hypothetical protein